MSRFARPAAIVAAALALALALAACGSTGSKTSGDATSSAQAAASSARAAASSAMANPTVSADLTRLENELLANFQKEIKATPEHPVKAVQAAVHDTFPAGDTTKIEQYAVQTFTVTMVHSTTARHQWAAGVASYALAQGGASPGSASIPGTTATPAATPATSTGGTP